MPIDPHEIRIRPTEDGFEVVDAEGRTTLGLTLGEVLECVIGFIGRTNTWPFYPMKLPEEWEAEGLSRRARIQERLTTEGKTE